MSSRRGWWILVEGPEKLVGNDSCSLLLQAIPCDGGPDQAVAQAAEVARTYVPSSYGDLKAEAYGRRVFRGTDRSWIVELTEKDWPASYTMPVTWRALLRVTIAELEHEQEAQEPERPVKKGRFGRS
jgi:hypothetical protein